MVGLRQASYFLVGSIVMVLSVQSFFAAKEKIGRSRNNSVLDQVKLKSIKHLVSKQYAGTWIKYLQ